VTRRRGIWGGICLVAWLTVLGAPAVPGERAPGGERPELLVAAAADLVFAFREIVPAFEREHPARVLLTLGSTGQLSQQILHGAPFDVLFAANVAFVEGLRAEGAVRADSIQPYARGALVLAWRHGAPPLADLRELGREAVRRVAIANPAHAPYGMAAREALERAGMWDRARAKLVYGENIEQALQFLRTGNVDAAILALSIVKVPELRSVRIDPGLYHPIVQAAAVTARSRHPQLARTFIGFVGGRLGRRIMQRYGFLPPGGP
jgi:molybdate transport system substrate-binding protein